MICEKCGCDAVGFDCDAATGEASLCSDCAFPQIAAASAAAAKAVEKLHFKRTGERKTSGEIFRGILDRVAKGYK